MATPGPATLNLTIDRQSGFEQDLQLQVGDPPAGMDLQGCSFYAQLWDAERSRRHVSLAVPVAVGANGEMTVLMSEAVAQGMVTTTTALDGGDAAGVGDLEGLSGGEAETIFLAQLSGGRAWMGLVPVSSRWDLLMVTPSGQKRVLLRGSATVLSGD